MTAHPGTGHSAPAAAVPHSAGSQAPQACIDTRIREVLACPVCRHPLHDRAALNAALELQCQVCNLQYHVSQGIMRLLPPVRQVVAQRFNALYDRLRLHEGFASTIPGFYRALPDRDLTGRNPQIWRRRSQSCRIVLHWLRRFAAGRSLFVVDAGAGSGWLSRRLAQQHCVMAVDTNAGPHGLAAFACDERTYTAVQAEMQALPLQDGCVDVVIAAASLHHGDPFAHLAEFRRVLRSSGRLVICDSPVYFSEEDRRRAHQRTQQYYASLGFPELAQMYRPLTVHDLEDRAFFRFTWLRRDHYRLEYMKKRLRHLVGRSTGAFFPILIGEPL